MEKLKNNRQIPNWKLCFNPLLPCEPHMTRLANILILILEEFFKKFTYELRYYESVDYKNLKMKKKKSGGKGLITYRR